MFKTLCVLLLLVFLIVPLGAQEKEWNRVVSEGRKEAKVIVTGDPDPVMRREIPARFTAKYGIVVEWIAARGGEIATRLQMERQAGVYTMDVSLAGIGTAANILHF